MDIKDQDTQLAATNFVAPDTGATPMEAELAIAPAEGIRPGTASQREQKSPSPLRESLRRLRRDKRAMASLIIILLFVIIPLIGPLIYQHIGAPFSSPTNGIVGPDKYHTFSWQELNSQDQGPSAQYWLGTDAVGRDLLGRLMQGMLVSLMVALIVEVLNVILGLSIGVLAGYFGGWIDQVLARFTDIMLAFPGLLFAILLAGIFGSAADTAFGHIPFIGANGNARLVLVSIALVITSWPLMARLVRGQTLQLKEQQFIEAARTSGTSGLGIILRHIIPNLLSIVVVAITLDISNTIIGEAALSFLGLGVQPPGSSIGIMVSDGTPLIETHPWEVLLPMLVLTIIVLAFSFLGDGMRDAFDSRSKD